MFSHKQVYDKVRKIPEGKVATYGQIAKLLGHPSHARQVGHALSAVDNSSKVPWHRVVNAKGMISPRGLNGFDDYQRMLLEDEGIRFNEINVISLKKFQWNTK